MLVAQPRHPTKQRDRDADPADDDADEIVRMQVYRQVKTLDTWVSSGVLSA